MILPRYIQQFLAQFTPVEYRQLCNHRAFLIFISRDIRKSASFAANLLNRCVAYPILSSSEGKQVEIQPKAKLPPPAPASKLKFKAASRIPRAKDQRRRFKF